MKSSYKNQDSASKQRMSFATRANDSRQIKTLELQAKSLTPKRDCLQFKETAKNKKFASDSVKSS